MNDSDNRKIVCASGAISSYCRNALKIPKYQFEDKIYNLNYPLKNMKRGIFLFVAIFTVISFLLLNIPETFAGNEPIDPMGDFPQEPQDLSYSNNYCDNSDGWGVDSSTYGKTTYPENIFTKSKEEYCLNSSTLIEYSCYYGNEQVDNSPAYFTQIECPYGCLDGQCIRIGTFCYNETCTSLNETYCGNSYGQTGIFKKSSVYLFNNFYDEYGNIYQNQRQILGSCIDTKTLQMVGCNQFIPEDTENSVPIISNATCPIGYGCKEYRCVQEKRIINNSLIGDVNKDNLINIVDYNLLKNRVNQTEINYNETWDLDGDSFIDIYDLYVLNLTILGKKPLENLPIRNLTVVLNESAFNEYSLEVRGKLIEGTNSRNMEYVKKGNSRGSCNPPPFNIDIKGTNSSGAPHRFIGISTYQNYTSLGYRKIRFIPACEVFNAHSVENLMREYVIYSMFRKANVPAVEVIAFASVNFNYSYANPIDLDTSKNYEYMILQRTKEEQDQIPFTNQTKLSNITEMGDITGSYDWDRFFNITVYENWDKINITQTLLLDKDNSIRYFMLTQFVDLQDRSVFWNEDYGYNGSTWKAIPYDYDISFNYPTSPFGGAEVLNSINTLVPFNRQEEYKKAYYNISKNYFDNPENLYYLLSLVDKFPFAENKDLMKNTLRSKFYTYALYYGSEDFANSLNQNFTSFKNMPIYIREANRILATSSYESKSDFDSSYGQEKANLQQAVNLHYQEIIIKSQANKFCFFNLCF